MNVFPTRLELPSPDRLRIVWSDDVTSEYTIRELRDACPCATCREKKKTPELPPNELLVLSPAEVQPLRIAAMDPVGNYAYSIHFSDGHDTGIFSCDLLRELGTRD